MIEAIAVWGYGQFVWIPVSVRFRPSTLQHMCSQDCLVYMYRPFLDIEVGVHRGGLRHIRVLYLRKCIPHSPNGTFFDYRPYPGHISLTISSGGLAREQDIPHPNRPLPRSRRLPFQGDVLQLLRRKDRHIGPHPIPFGPRASQRTRGNAFLVPVHPLCKSFLL